MSRETPQEAWERMRRANQASGRPSEPSPRPVAEPANAAGASGRPPGGTGVSDQREHSSGPARSQSEEPSAGELVKQLSEQTKTLVKQEMRLAKVELQEKGKKVGIGAGMFGAGGLVAFFGAEALIVAIVLALSTALAPWLSALIVGVVLLAAAGAAAVLGKKQIEEATPPMPEQTVETVKEDVQHLKRRAKP